MRSVIRSLIPNSWISIRKLYGSFIIFKSKEHLNLFFFKGYETEIWGGLNTFFDLKPDDIIIDIGANIGQAMLAMHSIFPKNEIYSYEPQPKEFDFAVINRLFNKIPGETFNKAVISGTQSTIDLFVDRHTGGRKSSMVDFSINEKIQVEAINFRNLLKSKVRLIKIDIEGYEAQLITPYRKFLYEIILIIEVRADTIKEIIMAFFDTHDIIHLETGNVVAITDYHLEFGNLLFLPKTTLR